MIRTAKLFVAWMSVPFLILCAAIALTVGGPRSFTSDSRFEVAHVLPDAKLHRTVGTTDSQTYPLERLSAPGLPMDMVILDDEWRRLRTRRQVESFREQPHVFALKVADQPIIRATYKVRGQNSLRHAFKLRQPHRLNFTVELPGPLPLGPGLRLNDFYLQNLAFDRYYFKMRFAYLVLGKMGLFPGHSQFVRLSVNGEPVGLFLLVERPKDAIRRLRPRTTRVYRRLSAVSLPYAVKHPLTGADWKGGSLERLHTAATELRGEPLVSELDDVLNLDAYFTWLAFNSLVLNPDSFDEVFFYLSGPRAGYPDRGRLELMAWDYDEIMASRPAHPNDALVDPLLFASEGPLDHAIQREPQLYSRFRRIFEDLLRYELTPDRLSAALATVREEVELIDMGLPDQDAIKAERRARMTEFETQLLARREALLATLGAIDYRHQVPK